MKIWHIICRWSRAQHSALCIFSFSLRIIISTAAMSSLLANSNSLSLPFCTGWALGRLWPSVSSHIQGYLSKKMCLQSISASPTCCFWKCCPSNCGRAGMMLWFCVGFSTTTKSHLASFVAACICSSLAVCQEWGRIIEFSFAQGPETSGQNRTDPK